MDSSFILLNQVTKDQLIIEEEGPNRIERLLNLIYLIDWISYYAALLNNVDPTPVNRIQDLKSMIMKAS